MVLNFGFELSRSLLIINLKKILLNKFQIMISNLMHLLAFKDTIKFICSKLENFTYELYYDST